MQHILSFVLIIIIAQSHIGNCCYCSPATREEKICRASYVGIVRLHSSYSYFGENRPQFIYQADQVKALIEGHFELGSNKSITLITNMFTGACGSPLPLSEIPEDNVYFVAAYTYGREKVTFGLCDKVFLWMNKIERERKYYTKENIATVCGCLEKKRGNKTEECNDKIVPRDFMTIKNSE